MHRKKNKMIKKKEGGNISWHLSPTLSQFSSPSGPSETAKLNLWQKCRMKDCEPCPSHASPAQPINNRPMEMEI